VNIIFDFDSTLVQAEGLDILARICFQKDKNKVEEIERITHLGMTGQITMQESLRARIHILQAQKKDLVQLIELLICQISPSIEAIKKQLAISQQNIYVLSGGFMEYVAPVCEYIGFRKENIIANRFRYQGEDIIGFDENILVSQTFGKPKTVQRLNLKSPIYLVGDGYTDLEVKLEGAADFFIAYTETITRENVIAQADAVCTNFYDVMNIIYEHRV